MCKYIIIQIYIRLFFMFTPSFALFELKYGDLKLIDGYSLCHASFRVNQFFSRSFCEFAKERHFFGYISFCCWKESNSPQRNEDIVAHIFRLGYSADIISEISAFRLGGFISCLDTRNGTKENQVFKKLAKTKSKKLFCRKDAWHKNSPK